MGHYDRYDFSYKWTKINGFHSFLLLKPRLCISPYSLVCWDPHHAGMLSPTQKSKISKPNKTKSKSKSPNIQTNKNSTNPKAYILVWLAICNPKNVQPKQPKALKKVPALAISNSRSLQDGAHTSCKWGL